MLAPPPPCNTTSQEAAANKQEADNTRDGEEKKRVSLTVRLPADLSCLAFALAALWHALLPARHHAFHRMLNPLPLPAPLLQLAGSKKTPYSPGTFGGKSARFAKDGYKVRAALGSPSFACGHRPAPLPPEELACFSSSPALDCAPDTTLPRPALQAGSRLFQ